MGVGRGPRFNFISYLNSCPFGSRTFHSFVKWLTVLMLLVGDGLDG